MYSSTMGWKCTRYGDLASLAALMETDSEDKTGLGFRSLRRSRAGAARCALFEECANRVLYLAYTTLALPFGPESGYVDAAKTEFLRRTRGILTVSNYVRDYIEQWSGLESRTLPLSTLRFRTFSGLRSI